MLELLATDHFDALLLGTYHKSLALSSADKIRSFGESTPISFFPPRSLAVVSDPSHL